MSLLTIVQDACAEIGFPVPVKVIGNTDQIAIQMLRLLNREGNSLSRSDWEALKKEHIFTLVSGTQTYSLPSDFRYIINGTSWCRDNKRQLIQPLTSKEWQFFKGWSTVNSLNLRARIRVGLFEFEQTIGASDDGKTIAFEYMSNSWAQSSAGAAQTEFLADTDNSLLDEELLTQGLVWRFRKAKGLQFEGDLIEYTRMVNEAKARDGGSRVMKLGGNSVTHLGVNTPEGNYGS